MITMFTGAPGNGKSAHMAVMIKNALRQGQNVICTIPINTDYISKGGKLEIGNCIHVPIEDLTPEYFYEYMVNNHTKPGKDGEIQTLVFMDECQIIFNSREWNKPGRKDWMLFFQAHRHIGFKLYLITQSDTFIDKQIRTLVQDEVRHRKISNLLWVFDILPIPIFIQRTESYQTVKKEKLYSDFQIGWSGIFKIYDSYTLYDEFFEKYKHLKAVQ